MSVGLTNSPSPKHLPHIGVPDKEAGSEQLVLTKKEKYRKIKSMLLKKKKRLTKYVQNHRKCFLKNHAVLNTLKSSQRNSGDGNRHSLGR